MERELRIYGMGGQGIITMGHLIGEAAVLDKKEVIMTEEYSPYITGGWSRADLILADEKIDYPMITELDYLITLSQEGFSNNLALMKKDAIVLGDKSMIQVNSTPHSVRVILFPAKALAESINSPRSMNIVMLGLFASVTKEISRESAITVIKKRFPRHQEPNLRAFELGYKGGIHNE